jgi:hypothetical protein
MRICEFGGYMSVPPTMGGEVLVYQVSREPPGPWAYTLHKSRFCHLGSRFGRNITPYRKFGGVRNGIRSDGL